MDFSIRTKPSPKNLHSMLHLQSRTNPFRILIRCHQFVWLNCTKRRLIPRFSPRVILAQFQLCVAVFFLSCRWPRSDIRSSLAKAFTGEHSQNCFSSRNWLCNQFNFAFSLHPRHDTPEQFAFDPFSITLFLYSMSLFEGKSSEAARQEVSGFYHPDPAINSHQSKCLFSTFLQVSSKFVSVYTIGFVYWPITQTINFAWVKPRNQVIYVSFASLIWTTFLAYMKVKRNFSFVTLPNWYLFFAKPSFPQAHPIEKDSALDISSLLASILAAPRNDSNVTVA